LLPRFLIERELEEGQLVRAVEAPPMPTGQYYLAYLPDRASYPPLAAFRDWIMQEIGADALAPQGSIVQ